jgi:2-polyprenyl-6-methoxyphenol hydroxylase-like FAD-dependent oxidoreductase
MPTHHHDVVVVGARAAGAATALLLARLGHDVVLLDRAIFRADTLSTHQIARTGVVQLHRWGLLQSVLDSGAPAIREVTFTVGDESTIRAIKDKAGVDLLVAPRRYILDILVADAAAQAGADVRLGVTVTGVRLDNAGQATGVYGHDRAGNPVEIDARFVVGADNAEKTDCVHGPCSVCRWLVSTTSVIVRERKLIRAVHGSLYGCHLRTAERHDRRTMPA